MLRYMLRCKLLRIESMKHRKLSLVGYCCSHSFCPTYLEAVCIHEAHSMLRKRSHSQVLTSLTSFPSRLCATTCPHNVHCIGPHVPPSSRASLLHRYCSRAARGDRLLQPSASGEAFLRLSQIHQRSFSADEIECFPQLHHNPRARNGQPHVA